MTKPIITTKTRDGLTVLADVDAYAVRDEGFPPPDRRREEDCPQAEQSGCRGWWSCLGSLALPGHRGRLTSLAWLRPRRPFQHGERRWRE